MFNTIYQKYYRLGMLALRVFAEWMGVDVSIQFQDMRVHAPLANSEDIVRRQLR